MTWISIDLTDSEWMSIIDQTDPDGLPYCCANVSELRDIVMTMARTRGKSIDPLTIHSFCRSFFNAQSCISSSYSINKIHNQLLKKDDSYKRKWNGILLLNEHQKRKEY